jgi:hypothetical protein
MNNRRGISDFVRLLAGLAITLTGLFVLSAPAEAARTAVYVSPDGTGTACTLSAPCSIEFGGSNSVNESDIYIAPGTYGSPSDPIDDRIYSTGSTVVWHGDPEARLHIDSQSSTASFTVNSSQQLLGNGMKIVSLDEIGLGIYGSGAVERVNVRTSLDDGVACGFQNEGAFTGGQLMTSLCVASGVNGSGVMLLASRNDEIAYVTATTAVATAAGGTGIGISNTGMLGGGEELSEIFARFSIASAPNGTDLYSVLDGPQNRACIVSIQTASMTGASGYCPINEINGLRELPGFVPGDPDYHLAASSPVINRLGPPDGYFVEELDLDGRTRNLSDPEPGAYDYYPPVAPASCRVPRLRGLKMPQVRRKLRRANCSLGRVTRRKVNRKQKIGRVLGQSHRAGRKLKAGARVRVTIGKRPGSRG